MCALPTPRSSSRKASCVRESAICCSSSPHSKKLAARQGRGLGVLGVDLFQALEEPLGSGADLVRLIDHNQGIGRQRQNGVMARLDQGRGKFPARERIARAGHALVIQLLRDFVEQFAGPRLIHHRQTPAPP